MDKILVQTSKRSVTKADIMQDVKTSKMNYHFIETLRSERGREMFDARMKALNNADGEQKNNIEQLEILEMLRKAGFNDADITIESKEDDTKGRQVLIIVHREDKSFWHEHFCFMIYQKFNRVLFIPGNVYYQNVLDFSARGHITRKWGDSYFLDYVDKDQFVDFLKELPLIAEKWDAEIEAVKQTFAECEQEWQAQEADSKTFIENELQNKGYDYNLIIGHAKTLLSVNVRRMRRLELRVVTDDIFGASRGCLLSRLIEIIDRISPVSEAVKQTFKITPLEQEVKVTEHSYLYEPSPEVKKARELAEISIKALVDSELQGKGYDYAIIKDDKRCVLTINLEHQRKLEISIPHKNFEKAFDGLCDVIERIKSLSDSIDNIDMRIVSINEVEAV